ncbi:beta-lactamase family protein [Hymenobacter sp. BRD128]|uniref:serine hydrolase domain-containing protein n=1 Tax=Hymenobacter sp. BRD128 TaxID=2675878 RepID=UPI0015632CC7|nr:serine hydrolase domain-containing protein [Hymenobacter sp. BRD128]QKG57072.1 beta-lactamase family protein [Hymenobacter sp. BRD128]
MLLLTAATGRPAHAQRASHVINSVPELTDSIRRVMVKEHIPGLMLVLATRDSVLYAGGLGEANSTTHQPVTAHTLFRIGSITKSFIALGLLQLIEQGKLHLNDEVRKIAPEVPIDNPWETTDPVRVVHLLEHTAGFDDMGLNRFGNYTATDLPGRASVELYRDELRCRWRPGERMAYSNPGYQIAGYLLEKFSGQSYEQYLTQHFLRPLGMPDATPTRRPGALPQLAQGYTYTGGRYEANPPFALYPGASGSMNASAADMARYVQFFLHDGRTAAGTALVQPASLREMETMHSTLAARNGQPTGYGLANYAVTVEGKAIYRGHGGAIPGFISALGYNRELGVGYALSNNGNHRKSRIELLVQQFLLRQAPASLPPAPVALATTQAAAYLGHYRVAAPRYQKDLGTIVSVYSLERRGPLLVLQPLIGKPDTLLATGPHLFRHPSELVASTVFTHDADGHRVLITGTTPAQYYLIEAGSWWWLAPALLALSGLLAVTASLAGLVWLVYALRRRLPRAQVLPRLLPLLATLAVVATAWAFTSASTKLDHLGRVSAESVLIFMGPLAFTAFALAGLALLLVRFRQFRSRLAAWYLLFTYGGLCFLVAVLGAYSWLGMRLWSV